MFMKIVPTSVKVLCCKKGIFLTIINVVRILFSCQDGQVYVLGSSQPTTVYEIVTETQQTTVETAPME